MLKVDHHKIGIESKVQIFSCYEETLKYLWNNKRGKINEFDYNHKSHKILEWNEITVISLSNLFIL